MTCVGRPILASLFELAAKVVLTAAPLPLHVFATRVSGELRRSRPDPRLPFLHRPLNGVTWKIRTLRGFELPM